MKRNGQTHGTFRRQTVDARNNACGTQSDTFTAQVVRVVVHHQLHSRNDVRQVEQRLPHAHQDNVSDAAPDLWRLPERARRNPQLADNFADSQVPIETLLRRRTKAAVQRTPDLR